MDDENVKPSHAGKVGAALRRAWLKAGIEQADGTIAARQKGTPQGGVVSPLFANLYLHHAFDMWMSKYFPTNPFERYADDIIVHCNTKDEAEQLLNAIKERLAGFALELHPYKTKLVYCKNYLRKEQHEHNSFTFLSYSFPPRSKPNTLEEQISLWYLMQPYVKMQRPLSGTESGWFSIRKIRRYHWKR